MAAALNVKMTLPLVGSGVDKPSGGTTQLSLQLCLHMKPIGHGPTSIIKKAEIAGILIALQEGYTDIASNTCKFFYKVKAQSGIINDANIGNEGADTCVHTAAHTDTTDIPVTRGPFQSALIEVLTQMQW
eukprot:1147689-Pelagomonas_calceolata.AAC.4